MKTSAGVPAHYRLAVTSRIIAALLGGYALAALCSIGLAYALPVGRADAVISGMMLSFLFYLGTVIWCFACRTALRAWLGVLACALLVGAFDGCVYWMRHS